MQYSFDKILFLLCISLSSLYAQSNSKNQTTLENRLIEAENKLVQYAEDNNIAQQYIENDIVYVLEDIDTNGEGIYHCSTNDRSAATIGTNYLQVGGELGLNLTGAGITLRLWESGGLPRATHIEFDGRVRIGDSSTAESSHATHVAGTMIARGLDSDAKGMACEANLVAFQTASMTSEMETEARSGAILSNHSYGTRSGWNDGEWAGNSVISTEEDYKFGFYNSTARDWDEIAFENPYYLICKSAGNDRNDSGDGTYPPDGPYDCLPTYANAKNIMTVGAVNDLPNGYTSASSVSITSFSSAGPSDDGRIKPDICANGASLYSSDVDSNTDYGFKSGTSMSAPSITGSLGLLQQHYKNIHGEFMLSSTLKALAIHTAHEAGDTPGPDYMHGHGLANMIAAANIISNSATEESIYVDELGSSDFIEYTFEAKGTSPIKATLVWTDVEGIVPPNSLDPETKMLRNDLDITVIHNNTNYYPWSLDKDNPTAAATNDSKNDTDNVEVVLIDNPVEGDTYLVRISAPGTIISGPQVFSLILSGSEGRPALPDAPNSCAEVTTLEVRKSCVPTLFSFANLTPSDIQPSFSCGVLGAELDAWFSFVVPLSGRAIVETVQVSGGINDLVLQSYIGTCEALIPLACDDDSGNGSHSKLDLENMLPGDTIYLRVVEYNAQTPSEKPFGICVYDNTNECIIATELIVHDSCIPLEQDNSNFVDSGISPIFQCSAAADAKDGWYSFKVPSSGNVSVETTQITGGLEDMVLQTYAGTCDDLMILKCNDDGGDGSHAKITLIGLTPEEVIYARVTSYNANETGTFGICAYDLGEIASAPSDLCTSAIELEVNNQCVIRDHSNENLINSGIVPGFLCGNSEQNIDAWFTVTIPESGNVTLETKQISDGLEDMVMQIYSGECNDLQRVRCDDDGGDDTHSRIDLFGWTPGEIFYIRVSAYDLNETGVFGICAYDISPTGGAPSDYCTNAIALPVNKTCIPDIYSNLGLTPSNVEPGFSCGSTGLTIDSWFTAIVPGSGALTIETTLQPGDLIDLVMQTYTGDCDNLIQLVCDDDTNLSHPKIELTGLPEGQLIYIRVVDYDSDNFGDFGICAYNGNPTPVIDWPEAKLTIYPNPASNLLNILVEGQLNYHTKIYDLTGRVVHYSQDQNLIDLDKIDQGTYFIEIMDNKTNLKKVEKIIIVK